MKPAAAARLLRRFVWCCALGAVTSAGVTAAAWWDGAVRGRVSAWRVIEGAADGPVAVARGRLRVFESRRYWRSVESVEQVDPLARYAHERFAPDQRFPPLGSAPPGFFEEGALAEAVLERIDRLGGAACAKGGKNLEFVLRNVPADFLRRGIRQSARLCAVEIWTAGVPMRCVEQARVVEPTSGRRVVPVTDPRFTLLGGPSFLVSPDSAAVVRIYPLAFAANTVAAGGLLWAGWSVMAAVQRAWRRRRGQCGACGYDVAGLATAGCVCPECGAGGA